MQPLSPKETTQLFNKYAGKEVSIMPEGCFGLKLDPADPVLNEMQKTADDNGVLLRFVWMFATADDGKNGNRVNAHIDRDQDGTWRIQPGFTIG